MERRLAAILLTDMVGYSQLMGLDEEGTIARQQVRRHEVFDPKISQHSGRIVKSTGDGLLVEFQSVIDAVRCAIELQTELNERDTDLPMDRRIQYRIGINLGDIVIDGEDILGDGVNVAARLEGLSKPGGICISGSVHDQLVGKIDIVFEDAGQQTVKNVPRPIKTWLWPPDKLAAVPVAIQNSTGRIDRPSIAVLPFKNLSSDSEQEFIADGMAEDIISGLSKFRWLLVVAGRSTFTYKGQNKSIPEIASELGSRYIVEGSVRSARNRIRVTAQLIDAETGN